MTNYWFCKTCEGWYRTIPPYYEYEGGECFECCVARHEGWDTGVGKGRRCDYNNRRRK